MSKELLDAERALAEKKQAHIDGLLKERVDLEGSTANRLADIAQELKDLGHKERRPRGPNKPKDNGTGETVPAVEE